MPRRGRRRTAWWQTALQRTTLARWCLLPCARTAIELGASQVSPVAAAHQRPIELQHLIEHRAQTLTTCP